MASSLQIIKFPFSNLIEASCLKEGLFKITSGLFKTYLFKSFIILSCALDIAKLF